MGEFADLKVITQQFMAGVDDMKKGTDRATMWALREVGRQLKREARRRAPVYRDRRLNKETFKFEAKGTSYRQMRAELKAGSRTGIGKNEVVAGLLKNSISSSRRLKKVGEAGYSLKLGPRGPRVHLYAQKIEASRPYMRPAYEELAPQMGQIAAKAWGRAMAKKSK